MSIVGQWVRRLLGGGTAIGGDDGGAGLSVRSKFLLMMLLTSLLSLGTITYLAYHAGKQALTDSATNQLKGIREAKKQQVEFYFRITRDATRAIADAPVVAQAIGAFAAGYKEFGEQTVSEERSKALEKFYADEFLPRLRANSDALATLEEYLPKRTATRLLQAIYMVENPNKIGEKDRLVRPAANDTYARAHATFHPWFKSVAERLKLYDVMLIDADTGVVVYSFSKEVDLGNDVTSAPLAGTNFGQLVRDVMRTQRAGEARFSDFAFYGPSHNIPATFVAAPVFRDQKLVGVLAGQISIEALSSFMHDGGKWREQGLGDTGAVYLVGQDQTMRSDTREIIEVPDKYLADIAKAGTVTPSVVERIRKQKTTVLHYPIRNEPVRTALRGQTGTQLIKNRRGQGVLFAYAPLDIPDLSWAIVARMDESEILASQIKFNRNVMIAACTLALLSTLAAMWLASRFLQPIRALLDGISRLRNGERSIQVRQRSRDEFGQLVGSFNEMATTLKERDELIEGKSRANEELLRRLFPETVAVRMKQGEASIVESYQSITIAYLIIDGASQLAEQRGDSASLELLSEIVDRIDSVAEASGLEKVKTIGEHYLAAAGLSVSRLDHARRTVEFARLAWREIANVNQLHGLSLSLRIGIATGKAQAGLLGSRRFVFDVWGPAPSIARRIAFDAAPNAIRLNADAIQQLPERGSLEGEMLVRDPSLGMIPTYQLRLDGTSASRAAE